jgi:hypothetical protein
MYEPKMREFTDASSNDFHLRAQNVIFKHLNLLTQARMTFTSEPKM